MRKAFSLVTIIILATLLMPLTLRAQQRNEASALNIARNFLSQRQQNLAKSSANRTTKMKLVATAKDNAYYIFNNAGGEGFVIVSGDQRMPPVLGYSSTTSIDPYEAIPENAAYWLSLYEKEYQAMQSDIDFQVPMLPASAYSDIAVEPMVTSKWGQNSPFNDACPLVSDKHCVTGCVATAMSQIMYKYQYPDCGTGSVSYTTSTNKISISENLANYPFDWLNMLDKYTSSATLDQESAVARLCYATGVTVNMNYGTSSSGAVSSNAMKALAVNFGYDLDMAQHYASYTTVEKWHQLIQSELQKGHPLLYSAQTPSGSAHAFVLDGYTPPTSDDDVPYYHFNWGWTGKYDGNYALMDLTPSTYDFSEIHRIITGIQPDDGVQTLGSYWHGTSKLSETKLKLSEVTSVLDSIKIYNHACRDFMGSIYVRLIKPDGKVKILKSDNLTKAYATSKGRVYAILFKPDAGAGIYTIEAYTKPSDSQNEDQVDLVGDLTIEVVDDVSGIEEMPMTYTSDNEVIGVYSIDGRRILPETKGIQIIKYKDSKVVKKIR